MQRHPSCIKRQPAATPSGARGHSVNAGRRRINIRIRQPRIQVKIHGSLKRGGFVPGAVAENYVFDPEDLLSADLDLMLARAAVGAPACDGIAARGHIAARGRIAVRCCITAFPRKGFIITA